MGVIFDINSFKEHRIRQGRTAKIHHYASENIYNPDATNQRGDTTSPSEQGFILAPRIAPRFITGLILNRISEERRDPDCFLSETNIVNLVKIVKVMIGEHQLNPKINLLPVYNSHGDLLWPEQMSYEEVKEFVAERERKKKETKESADTQETISGSPIESRMIE